MNSGRVLVRNRRALRRRIAVVPTPLTQPGTDLRVEQAAHDMAEEMAEEPRPQQPLRRSRRTRRPCDRLIEHDDIWGTSRTSTGYPPYLLINVLSINFLFSLFHHLTRGRCTGVSTPVHSFLLLFFSFFHLFLSLLQSLDLEGGDVVISIEPVRYATYVYLPMCSTRSGRPLLATSGPPSSLLLVLDLAPRVRLLSVAPYSSSSSSFIMYWLLLLVIY